MRALPRFLALCGLVLGLVTACSPAADEKPVAFSAGPVIYDADDRTEPALLSGEPWVAASVGRAVALVPSSFGGTEALATPTAMERFRLCAEERFADQPSLADCSGVLVENDLVLTAGHCFGVADTCDKFLYTNQYTHEATEFDAGGPTLLPCKELIIREVGQLADGRPIDYALIRLEGPVDEIDSTLVVREQALTPEETIVVMGFPEGLPLKVDPKGKVAAVDRTGLHLWTDAYQGSSGSGIYDHAGSLAGILSSGETDFQWDEARGCQFSRVVTSGDTSISERAMNARLALLRACFRVPDLALCKRLTDTGTVEGGGSTIEGVVESTIEGVVEPRRQVGRPASVLPSSDAGVGTFTDSPGLDAAVAADDQSKSRSGGCSFAPTIRLTGDTIAMFSLLLLPWLRRRAFRAGLDKGATPNECD